ncbi:uncharacterized protein LOC135078348 [Ostrinia nubilalis]|uniref:uncharacterized protein LOC135078348 n=1 Tax=Ostrinia nubilalis TaxID=29057 RepID=UPI0030823923
MVSRILRPIALGRLRLAHVDDAPVIMNLVTESMSKNFRIDDDTDIVYLIQNCVLCICQLDINDSIVGFLAAKDYPLLPSVHPRAWEEYIWTKYKSIELNARNTLFIHLLCWNPAYARELVDSLLKSMFMHDPYLQHVAMLKPLTSYPLLVPGQSRSEASFRRVQAMERGVPGEMLPALCIADRAEVSPRLRIRRAVPAPGPFRRARPECQMLPALCIADRAEVSPRLRIRRAVLVDTIDDVDVGCEQRRTVCLLAIFL